MAAILPFAFEVGCEGFSVQVRMHVCVHLHTHACICIHLGTQRFLHNHTTRIGPNEHVIGTHLTSRDAT